MHRLNLSDTRHLVSRTALGQEWRGVKALQGKSRAEAVSILLHPGKIHTPAAPKLTPWMRLNRMSTKNGNGKRMARRQMLRENDQLKQWMVKNLLTTKTPVNERMTLFWHNHFTTSLDKIEHPHLVHQQSQFLRKNAMGSFAHMLHNIAKDPAMLVFLDGSKNVKGKPNENFARELLELFTLGKGHNYTEADIRAAAIAFTGWGVDMGSGKFHFDGSKHDSTPVTFMGTPNITSGDQVINVLLKHPRTAVYVAEKVWKEFVSDGYPDPRVTQQWGKIFRDSNYNIKTLMTAVLNSDAFWSPRHRGNMIKSPIDLVVGTLRILPFPNLPTKELSHVLSLLGQDMFDPPTVKGWDGGKSWIDTQTLLVRTSLLNKLTRTTRANSYVAKSLPNTTGKEVVDWLLPITPVLSLPTHPGKIRLVRALILDPTYQLK